LGADVQTGGSPAAYEVRRRVSVPASAVDFGDGEEDACRTADGRLLLVELEDLNPYLSLELLDTATHDAFVQHMTASLHRLVRT
jgi:hypothetical protein